MCAEYGVLSTEWPPCAHSPGSVKPVRPSPLAPTTRNSTPYHNLQSCCRSTDCGIIHVCTSVSISNRSTVANRSPKAPTLLMISKEASNSFKTQVIFAFPPLPPPKKKEPMVVVQRIQNDITTLSLPILIPAAHPPILMPPVNVAAFTTTTPPQKTTASLTIHQAQWRKPITTTIIFRNIKASPPHYPPLKKQKPPFFPPLSQVHG